MRILLCGCGCGEPAKPDDIHGVGPTPVTRPLHLACLMCDPSAVFFTLRHLVEHLEKEHPRSLRVVQE